MLASRPVEVQGRFLGVAVTHEASWRFVAVHPSVCDIDGATFSSPAEAKRVAELVLARGGGARHSQRPAEGPSVAGADLVPSDLVYADRTGETTSVCWSRSHRWVSFPRLRPDEALPIKCHDSAADGRARFSVHGAFADPPSAPDAPPRESIEGRTRVSWARLRPVDA